MRNIRLTIQYDGTDYNGWQKQINTHNTIQEIFERILKKLLREKISIIGAGRTDAGVHAKCQIANFHTSNFILLSKLKIALNSLLPKDIKVLQVKEVSRGFHSRFQAKEKTYRYTILNRSYTDVFLHRLVYLFEIAKLDVKAMQKAAQYLVGCHDFSSFKIAGDGRSRSNVRSIKNIRITRKGDFIAIDISGKGFLHKMVRSIVGTLLEVGRGKLPIKSLGNILRAKNRNAAGPTAPACGLCLIKIRY